VAVTELPRPLADISEALAGQRSRLIDALRGLRATDTVRSPGAEEWSAAQVVDHLLLAEGFTNDLTKMMVERAEASGDAAGFPADLTVFDPLPPPRGMEAPPPIRPRQQLPPAELIAALEAMGERSRSSFAAMASFDPRQYSMEHPLFGLLDLGQWWMVHPVHYEMHIAQAQEALKARGE